MAASIAAFVILGAPVAGAQTVRPVPRPAAPASRPPTAERQLANDLQKLTISDGVRRGLWGVIVYSLDRRQHLFDLNPQALLVPASTAKLLSVASAYEAVGWNYRFQTTVWATGPIVDGTLKGDLVVSGSGDPSIASRGFSPLEDWVTALKELGVQTIDGRVIGDDDAIEEPRPSLAWAWDDLGYPTGAVFGALNAEENRMTVTVTPGATNGSTAQLSTEPRAEHRPLVSRVTTTTGGVSELWPEQRPAEAALTIAGTVRQGAKPATLSVSAGNPTRWFAGLLRHHLIAGGVPVTGEALDVDDVDARPHLDDEGAQTLFVHRSPTLGELVQPLLKLSINVYGEAFLRLNSRTGVFPTNDAALDALKTRMASWGVTPDAAQVIDGSGLSRRDAVSPDALLAVLQRMYDPTGESPFMQALPIAGVDGSLFNRMRNSLATKNVRAKTGTMSNIRTLAGYVTTADGEQMALVVMVNNFEGTGVQALDALDAMAPRVASFSRNQPAPSCCAR
jgi:D-alanyl-D-alanine carboxypeptidase/D-alanyl-D-alanine-endopeptidase (penicillin-binding protein 4)